MELVIAAIQLLCAKEPVKCASAESLPFPTAKPSRANWTPAQLATFKPVERVALRRTGFLTHATNVENTGSGESTNCHFHTEDDVDWHIYLQESPGETIDKAVIVETTPRVASGIIGMLPCLTNRWKAEIRYASLVFSCWTRRIGTRSGSLEVRFEKSTRLRILKSAAPSSCSDSDCIPLDQLK